VATCCSSTGSSSCLLRHNLITSKMLSFHNGFGADLPHAFDSMVIRNRRACLALGRLPYPSFSHHSIFHSMKFRDRHYWLLNSAKISAVQC